MPRFCRHGPCGTLPLISGYCYGARTSFDLRASRGLQLAGLFFFGSLPTVIPGLYGHSCRAENYAVILVELNGSSWQTQICLTQRGRARGVRHGASRNSAATGQQDGAGAQNAAGAGFGQAAI